MALPPGTPPPSCGRSCASSASREDVAGGLPDPPRSPWTDTFSAGTRISTGLERALDEIRDRAARRPAVVLVSDLDDSTSDLDRLRDVALAYRHAGIPLHVVGLNPAPEDAALIRRLRDRGRLVRPQAALPRERPRVARSGGRPTSRSRPSRSRSSLGCAPRSSPSRLAGGRVSALRSPSAVARSCSPSRVSALAHDLRAVGRRDRARRSRATPTQPSEARWAAAHLAARRPCGRDPRRRATSSSCAAVQSFTAPSTPSGDRQRGAPRALRAAAEVALCRGSRRATRGASQASNLIGVLAETDARRADDEPRPGGVRGGRSRGPGERGRGVQPRAHPAAPASSGRERGRDRDRAPSGRRRGPGRACPGWGTDGARALDRAARSAGCSRSSLWRCFPWRRAPPSCVRQQRRGAGRWA